MPYTEVQVKNGIQYWYRTLSVREGKRFKKHRIYLGKSLSKKELKEKEQEADWILESEKPGKLSSKKEFEAIFRTRWNVHHNRASIAPILTAAPLYDVFSTGFKPLFGDSYNQLLAVYQNNNMRVCWPENKMKNIGKIVFKQLFEDPALLEKNRALFETKSKILLRFLKKAHSKPLSIPETVKVYNRYFQLYQEACLWGEPVPFAVYKELTHFLENVLQKAVSNPKQRLQLFTLLITPTEPSFINREEKGLEAIHAEIQRDNKIKALFQKSAYAILDEIKKFPVLFSQLKSHQQKYFWMSYDYFGEPLGIDFFVKQLKEKPTKQPASKNNSMDALRKKQALAFERLLAEKKISEKEKMLFLAAQQATLLLDYKKEKLSQAHYYLNDIIQKAAERNRIPPESILFAMPNELSLVFSHKINPQTLVDRKEKSAFYCSKNGSSIFTGSQADQIIEFLHQKKKNAIHELSGICASPGTRIGYVKLVKNRAEIHSIRKGEILVTGMTTPEYLVAMKKASAIITDEGGITCHAAIVSRELGIPCIVGTKNATQVLKNGDLIEIHAANGTIKIIKRSKNQSLRRKEK